MLRLSSLFRVIKPVKTAEEAVTRILPGATLLVGGFGTSGSPHHLVEAVSHRDVNKLKVYSNGSSFKGWCIGILIEKKMISRLGVSHLGVGALAPKAFLKGELELELIPQGSLAERMRAGGAGIPAFFTRAGAGTDLEYGRVPSKLSSNSKPRAFINPREARVFKEKHYIMERAIIGDVALIKAWKADRAGNLVFRHAQANFNVAAGMAAKHTIVEVEELVDQGQIPPEEIHLPGIYVSVIVHAPKYPLVIEHPSPAKEDSRSRRPNPLSEMSNKEKIQRRAALELRHGMPVNLGIGIPVGVQDYVDPDMTIFTQAENGFIGGGPSPEESEVDGELIDAGKRPVTLIPGGSTFPSHESFGMIRGGHIELTMLGALEVAYNGDLANWVIPGKMINGMGGAMDLVSSSARVVILTEHASKSGKSKIVNRCSLPLTSRRCVSRIITELAVFDVDINPESVGGLTLIEIASDATLEQVKECTEARFDISPKLASIKYSWF